MEETKKTVVSTAQMLEDQIRETLEDLELARFSNEESIKSQLDKLKTLHQQHLDLQKLEGELTLKRQQLELDALKLENETKTKLAELEMKEKEQQKNAELNALKIENETKLKVTELELKEKEQKQQAELEEKKLKEQKKSNTVNAVIGGVTAATGLAGIIASVSCFKKSLRFEETGSFTNKSSQHVGGIFNLFRRRG